MDVQIEMLRGCRAGVVSRGMPTLRTGEVAAVPEDVAALLISQGYAKRVKAPDEPGKDKMQHKPDLKKG